MTIREHYKHVYNVIKYAVWAYCGVIAAVILWRHVRGPMMFIVVFLAVFPIGLISQPLWRSRFLCPRCHVDLVKLDSQLDPQDFATRLGDAFLRHEVRKQFWQRRDACPQCGLSFDSPWPSR